MPRIASRISPSLSRWTRRAELEQSKKFRDVARTGRAAIVIDDLESTDPWRPRGIEVRGRAEAITMPTPLIQIYPERIVSWGLGQSRSGRTVAS
jgi:pyridoxamine 5'-phosphate oxidase family protein